MRSDISVKAYDHLIPRIESWFPWAAHWIARDAGPPGETPTPAEHPTGGDAEHSRGRRIGERAYIIFEKPFIAAHLEVVVGHIQIAEPVESQPSWSAERILGRMVRIDIWIAIIAPLVATGF